MFPLPLPVFPQPKLPELADNSSTPQLKTIKITDLFKIEDITQIQPKPLDKLKLNRKLKERPYTLYPLTNLKELADLVFSKEKSKDTITLRYVVLPDYTFLFGREGSPAPGIPAHREMTKGDPQGATILAAGNVTIKNIYKPKSTNEYPHLHEYELESINHKSGDFSPEFKRVLIAVGILYINKDKLTVSLPKKLIIKELNSIGGDFKNHLVDINEISGLTNKLKEETIRKFKNQPDESIVKEPGHCTPESKITGKRSIETTPMEATPMRPTKTRNLYTLFPSPISPDNRNFSNQPTSPEKINSAPNITKKF